MEFPYPECWQYKRMVEWINSYEDDLWNNLERVPQMELHVGRAILSGLLELACQAQNTTNILSGRHGIRLLPTDWVLEHIEVLAEPLLQFDDDWEWWRLMEVYDSLDKNLAKKLALRAVNHPHHNIKEVGETYLER